MMGRTVSSTSCSATQLYCTTRSLLRDLVTYAPLLPEPNDELEAIVVSFTRVRRGTERFGSFRAVA